MKCTYACVCITRLGLHWDTDVRYMYRHTLPFSVGTTTH